jgi:hypothetical protein
MKTLPHHDIAHLSLPSHWPINPTFSVRVKKIKLPSGRKMQIPLWGFLGCIFLAAVWHDMASLLLRHSAPLLRVGRYITPSLAASSRILPTTPSTSFQSKAFYSTAKTSTKMPSSTDFLSALKSRRTYYALKSESPIPDAKIQEIINQVVLHVPSSFNSQSTRVVLLLKGEHEKLWDITRDVLKGIVPAEQFASTEQKMGAFKAGYGTVLPLPFPP